MKKHLSPTTIYVTHLCNVTCWWSSSLLSEFPTCASYSYKYRAAASSEWITCRHICFHGRGGTSADIAIVPVSQGCFSPGLPKLTLSSCDLNNSTHWKVRNAQVIARPDRQKWCPLRLTIFVITHLVSVIYWHPTPGTCIISSLKMFRFFLAQGPREFISISWS